MGVGVFVYGEVGVGIGMDDSVLWLDGRVIRNGRSFFFT